MIVFPLVLFCTGGLIYIAVAALLARMLLMPPRMTDGKALHVLKRLSPGDLALPFQDVSFDVFDARRGEPHKLRITGWWIPGSPFTDRTVLFLHGFADAKVGAIAWAPTWISLGYNVLAIDLRAHGSSGGRVSTAGCFERSDVVQVLNQLRAERPGSTRRVVLFGVSVGAAVAVATAASLASQGTNVDALVLDSAFGDFRRAAAVRAKGLGVSLPGVLRVAIRLAEAMSGARFADVRPIDLISQVRCPILMIRGENDRLADSIDFDNVTRELSARHNPLDDSWIVESTDHLLALARDAHAYLERIERFLSRQIQG